MEPLEPRRLLAVGDPWAIGLDGNGDLSVSDQAVDDVGNIYLTGSFSDGADLDPHGSGGLLDCSGGFVAKYAGDGTFQWAQKQAGYVDGVALDSFGIVYISGQDCDAFVTKLDGSGKLVWAMQVGGPGFDYGSGLATDRGNNLYLFGSFEDTVGFGATDLVSRGAKDAYLAKLDSSGTVQWAQRMGGEGDDYAAYFGIGCRRQLCLGVAIAECRRKLWKPCGD